MKVILPAALAFSVISGSALAQEPANTGAPPAAYPICSKPGQDRCQEAASRSPASGPRAKAQLIAVHAEAFARP